MRIPPTTRAAKQFKASTQTKAQTSKAKGEGSQIRDVFESRSSQRTSKAAPTEENGFGKLAKLGLVAAGGFFLSKLAAKFLGKSESSSAGAPAGQSQNATPFPDAAGVICESVTSEGTGAYHGTAGFLFPPSWRGKIDSVKLGNEVGQMGTPHNGKDICRFLKPGHEYTWPQTLTISSGGKAYSMPVTQEMMLGTSSPGGVPGSASGTSGGPFDGTTKKLDGGGGFLWKPTSENDGKLVVLLPSSYAGKVKSVEVQDAQGNTLGTGKFSSNANGGRDHFRFGKSGASFGNNVYVVATLSSGEKVRYPISNGGARND